MLLVLLLGIADFGRVFAAGITVEAAARDAAEAAAQEYLRNPPGPMDQPAPASNDAYYQALHDLAARTACREAKDLPNTTFSADACDSMPVVQVCVHDNADPLCDQTAFGATIPAPGCAPMETPLDTSMNGGSELSRYVEVRICYRFTTLFNLSNLQLPFGWSLSLGDVWLQKDRTFTIGWYPPLPTPVPPPPPSAPPSEPAPTDSPTPSPSPSGSESATPSPSATPTPTPTPTPVCQVPLANFTATPVKGTSPLNVQFTDQSVALDCPVTAYDWDFGDGSTHAAVPNPSHQFVWNGPANSRTFQVLLRVSSAAGSATKQVNVTVNKP